MIPGLFSMPTHAYPPGPSIGHEMRELAEAVFYSASLCSRDPRRDLPGWYLTNRVSPEMRAKLAGLKSEDLGDVRWPPTDVFRTLTSI